MPAIPPLRDHMDLVYEGIATKGQILVALDFDGTLSEIVARPEDATLTEERRQLLRDLNSRPRFAVAVISGRTVDDVRERVGLSDIAYAGHHGLEIAGPGFSYLPPEAEAFRGTAARLGESLEAEIGRIPGVIFEHRGISLGVHYRLVSGEQREVVQRAIRAAINPLAGAGEARVVLGKEVVNVLPPLVWHKGSALRWLIGLLDSTPHRVGGIFPIYIGDDVTDEDAFPVAREAGIAIRVGPPSKETAAEYSLADPAEVEATLRAMVDYSKSLGIG